jgi:hypothetical protein
LSGGGGGGGSGVAARGQQPRPSACLSAIPQVLLSLLLLLSAAVLSER